MNKMGILTLHACHDARSVERHECTRVCVRRCSTRRRLGAQFRNSVYIETIRDARCTCTSCGRAGEFSQVDALTIACLCSFCARLRTCDFSAVAVLSSNGKVQTPGRRPCAASNAVATPQADPRQGSGQCCVHQPGLADLEPRAAANMCYQAEGGRGRGERFASEPRACEARLLRAAAPRPPGRHCAQRQQAVPTPLCRLHFSTRRYSPLQATAGARALHTSRPAAQVVAGAKPSASVSVDSKSKSYPIGASHGWWCSAG